MDHIKTFTAKSAEILGDVLTGIYLHGSAAMGCYNPDKSDIDLLIVTETKPDDDMKRRFMDIRGISQSRDITNTPSISQLCLTYAGG